MVINGPDMYVKFLLRTFAGRISMQTSVVQAESREQPVVDDVLPIANMKLTIGDAQSGGIWIWTIGAVGLLLLIVNLIWWFKQAHRARGLSQALELFAKGDFEEGNSITQDIELGELNVAFDLLKETLSERFRKLEKQRQAQDDQRQLLQSVLSTLVAGVVAFDASERVTFANKAAYPMLDVESGEIVGRLMLEVTRNITVHQVVRRVLAGEASHPVEIDIARTESHVQIIAVRLPGEPCPGAVLIFQDVTELRRLEVMRSQFVSNVSHELKTPLTSISAYAETLLDGALEDERNCRLFVERIDQQAHRLHELILDLLRLASIESQDLGDDIGPISVAKSVERCISDHRALFNNDAVRLQVDPPDQGDAIHVRATDEGLRTILNNLLANAVKFTSEGEIRIGWRVQGGRVRIEVEDSGCGIAQEHQARVFERFFRTDSARTRDAGGTGLGLAIVKHLTQSFHGQVELSSELGVGSCFSVILPCHEI